VTELRERLQHAPLPGEADAAARSWPVVEAALAEREPGARGSGAPPRRMAVRLALVAALIAVGLVVALSPAGAWIGDRFDNEPTKTRPAFAALPPGGSVLAISRTGAYAIHPDGSTQRLGSFFAAGWSPHGEHVVGVQSRRLTAVNPLGTVKWTLVRRGVHGPAWSTRLGFAVAYLQGQELRVVDGTGDPATDRRVRGGAAPVTPAWRPRSDSVLTYAGTGGSIETVDVTTGQRLWSAQVSQPPLALAWSRDGRRLVALSSRSVTALDQAGRVLRTVALTGVARDMALHPSGGRAAVVVRSGALEVPLTGGRPRQLFQGDVAGIAWSADGRRLLLGSRSANQWLLLGPGDHIRALDGVSRELGTAGGFPRVAGWCCSG
jgi:Flp pilus assembly pilin Flp